MSSALYDKGAKKNMKKWLLPLFFTVVLVLSACGDKKDDKEAESKTDEETNKELELVYVEWDTEVASTNVIATVLEDMGYKVTVTPLDNAIMWESIASGETDAMVAGWLPTMHGPKMDTYKDDVMDLGPNLEGTKVGLVVPAYMDVDSIADLKDEANKTITGIEPGANMMMLTEALGDQYPNLKDWTVMPSSSGAMTAALTQAYNNKEDIVVTGWSPHWKFTKYDLKYLDDPENVYGGDEAIHTITRLQLDKDQPEAFKVLDNFYWTPEDIGEVMLDIADGMDAKEAARKWVDDNADKVKEWTK